MQSCFDLNISNLVEAYLPVSNFIITTDANYFTDMCNEMEASKTYEPFATAVIVPKFFIAYKK